MRVLLIDNYDSFTFNLAQGFAKVGAEVCVHRNDTIDLSAARSLRPTHVVLSPGPGRPEDSGVCADVLAWFAGRRPVLGVCLGHQLLAAVHGGSVVQIAPVHGRASAVVHDGQTVFAGLPSPFQAARYHSLAVEASSLSDAFEVSALTDGIVMGVRHRPTGAEGVQFHPESVLTPLGQRLLENFLTG